MPNVTATPRSLRNGEVITEFTDTTSTTAVTYTYPLQQAGISVENSGVADIFVTVGSYTNQVVNPNKTWKADVAFTSLSIRSNANSQEFTATAFQNDIEGSEEADSIARGMINTVSSQLAGKANQAAVNASLALKSDKTYVDNLITSVNASPKGVYAAVTDLQTAYPTGNANIYLVTADGKWYYWNGSAWTEGGTYQSTGVADLGLTSGKYANQSIEPEKTNFISVSSNLLNHFTAIKNKSISTSTGNLVDNTTNSASDFIPIFPNTIYTSAGLGRKGFYTIDKKFISSDTVNGTFTTPSNAYYMRFIGNNVLFGESAQLNLGGTLLPYEPYYIKISSLQVLSDNIQKTKYFLPPEPITGWYQAPVVEAHEAVDHYSDTIPLDYVYNKYDALVSSNPDYVTKSLLGNDQSGTYPIYKYEFVMPDVATSKYSPKKPKIIINPTIHGEEKGAALSTLYFMEDVCNNWQTDKLLEYVKHNVHLIIIAIANPYGWVNHQRQNVNGVDLNRNSDYFWSDFSSAPGSETYKGSAPFSELESQYIKSVVDNNLDAIAFYDYHMNGTSGDAYNTMFWHNLGNLSYKLNPISKYNISQLTIEAQKRYGLPSNSGLIGYVSYTGNGPFMSCYPMSKGIASGIIECTRKMVGETNVYSATALSLDTEFIGNTVLNTIKEFSRR